MFWFKRPQPQERGPQFLKADGPMAFRVRVRTARHGEVIEVRFTKSGDISATEGGGYFVRKYLVGPKFYDQATLEVSFNNRYGNPKATVEGGEVIPLSEWED